MLNSCIWSGIFFVVTQLIKTFLLATFMMIPEDSNRFSLSQELPILLVGLLDFVGIYLMHQRLQRKGTRKPNHLRILTVALGWACAEALVHYLLPLWIGARDVDFSWDYIEMGLLSNVNLALHLSNSASVFLGMRNDLDPIAFAMVLASCALQVSLPTLGNYMSLSLNKSSSTVLMLRMAIAVPLLGMSWINFRVYDRKKNI